MRDDQRRVVPVEERPEHVRDRWQTAPSVDQDRHAAIRGEREHGLEPWVVGKERLRAGMQLDPARTEVETARRLLEGSVVEVQPHERNELVRRLRRLASVRSFAARERGRPIGLVEAEEERARDARTALHREQLVAIADRAVDVRTEVCVDVEQLEPGGNLVEHRRQ